MFFCVLEGKRLTMRWRRGCSFLFKPMLAPRRDIQTRAKLPSSSDQSRGWLRAYRNKTCKKTMMVMDASKTAARYLTTSLSPLLIRFKRLASISCLIRLQKNPECLSGLKRDETMEGRKALPKSLPSTPIYRRLFHSLYLLNDVHSYLLGILVADRLRRLPEGLDIGGVKSNLFFLDKLSNNLVIDVFGDLNCLWHQGFCGIQNHRLHVLWQRIEFLLGHGEYEGLIHVVRNGKNWGHFVMFHDVIRIGLQTGCIDDPLLKRCVNLSKVHGGCLSPPGVHKIDLERVLDAQELNPR